MNLVYLLISFLITDARGFKLLNLLESSSFGAVGTIIDQHQIENLAQTQSSYEMRMSSPQVHFHRKNVLKPDLLKSGLLEVPSLKQINRVTKNKTNMILPSILASPQKDLAEHEDQNRNSSDSKSSALDSNSETASLKLKNEDSLTQNLTKPETVKTSSDEVVADLSYKLPTELFESEFESRNINHFRTRNLNHQFLNPLDKIIRFYNMGMEA